MYLSEAKHSTTQEVTYLQLHPQTFFFKPLPWFDYAMPPLCLCFDRLISGWWYVLEGYKGPAGGDRTLKAMSILLPVFDSIPSASCWLLCEGFSPLPPAVASTGVD